MGETTHKKGEYGPRRRRIIELLKAGWMDSEIAKEVGSTRQYVGLVKKESRQRGEL